MKHYLMEHYHVPEDAILIDPVARHTTTNMRNAARLLLRVGAPEDKRSLVTGQVSSIVSGPLKERQMRDQGYIPFQLGDRIDFNTVEFMPLPVSFHRDASDPMDP
jgi:hypothetical protein